VAEPDSGALCAELVLPFVVRIERATPPTRTDALEAAARGVLLVLTDPRPEWHDAIAAWDAQRIRKVVRRARGAEWRRADALDGLTVVRGSAEVRVFPPVPIDAWPRDLARLQVGGTDLDDPSPPPPVDPATPLVLLSPRYAMTAGKAMAQAAHAAQLGWRASSADARRAWRSGGFELAVRVGTAAAWARAIEAGAPVVEDAGFTEVQPGAETALAVLPWL
jgi:peptidyl-tRNA hydrolase